LRVIRIDLEHLAESVLGRDQIVRIVALERQSHETIACNAGLEGSERDERVDELRFIAHRQSRVVPNPYGRFVFWIVLQERLGGLNGLRVASDLQTGRRKSDE
jgi:hypothetical protein